VGHEIASLASYGIKRFVIPKESNNRVGYLQQNRSSYDLNSTCKCNYSIGSDEAMSTICFFREEREKNLSFALLNG